MADLPGIVTLPSPKVSAWPISAGPQISHIASSMRRLRFNISTHRARSSFFAGIALAFRHPFHLARGRFDHLPDHRHNKQRHQQRDPESQQAMAEQGHANLSE